MSLVESIKMDSYMLSIRPIVVDMNMVVQGGNQRLRACQVAGFKEIYIIKADDLSTDQLREFVIKDNLHFGEWDKKTLAIHYSDKEMIELGMDLVEVSTPRMETIGDIEPEIDASDLSKKKETYDNNKIKQIVVYYPSDIYEKVINSINLIKDKMRCKENPEFLLKLISYWKMNYGK